MNDVGLKIETRPAAQDARIDWEAIRMRYPAVVRSTFLNITSGTPLSTAAKSAVDALVAAQWMGKGSREERYAMLAETRERFARVIGGEAREIAVTKNVTEGLNIVANAIDWKTGDNVVVCAELEHPNNIYLWYALRERGVEVRAISARDGAIDTASVLAAIDARTRIVTTASVTFTPGFRTDLATIGAAARRAGALFLVDAVQSCGILEMDVAACSIDALVTSTSKGLMGLAGLGFLYVRSEWIARLTPVYIGRYSVERGKGHESEIEGEHYALLPDARRFEAGNYNWPGIAAAHASIGELLEVGIPTIEARAVKLATALADGLRDAGLPVTQPPAGVKRSHIVTVGEFGAGDARSSRDPKLNAVNAALTEAGVKFTVRKGQLRFGFHLYNDLADVERVLEAAGQAALA